MASVVLRRKRWHDRSQNYTQISKKLLKTFSGRGLKIGLH